MKLFLSLILLFVSVNINSVNSANENCPETGKYVMCYYGSWAQYRFDFGAMPISAIDPTLCTHLIFAFAGINLDGEMDSLSPEADFPNENGDGNYYEFNQLKEKNPCMKTLLAIGGWNEGSEKYSIMAATEKRREEFVDRVERFLVHYDFDGLDFDWEYPTQRGGITEDRENFAALVMLLGERLRLRRRILTVAVGAPRYLQNVAYDVQTICQYADFLLLMAYDLQFSDLTSTQAPINREPSEPIDRETVDVSLRYFIDNGCPTEKVILGIPAYGRTFTLASQTSFGLGANVVGPGEPGPYTKEEGFKGYNEICESLMGSSNGGWTLSDLTNNIAKVAVKGTQWIGYDDEETVKGRTRFAEQQNLAGVMFWSIDTDDFHGYCFSQSFPLLRAANDYYGNNMTVIPTRKFKNEL